MELSGEEIDRLFKIAQELKTLLNELEKRLSPSVLDGMQNQCWIARRLPDPMFGGFMENITRVQAEIKITRKTGNLIGLHTAVTRVEYSVDKIISFMNSTKQNE